MNRSADFMSIALCLPAFLLFLPLLVRLWQDVRVNRRFNKLGARTVGELVGFTLPSKRHRHGPGSPVATYVVDGKKYTVNDDGDFAREGPFRGRPLTICYDPNNPADAVIRRPFDAAEPALLVLLCIAEAVLIVSVGIALLHVIAN